MRQPENALDDPADLAAAIAEMDLVLTADPLVAHLAGAMAVPAVVLLPPAIDWRWQSAPDEKARWYPSVQVERLTPDGLTDDVMRRLQAMIAGLSRS